ncbi:DNA-binding transcriptional LysR family regulator [Variovorax sp. OAS795]|uniref:LysR substrate-binding domain-containing protein n=1 Tax=Variovorax sp. OAS795 TaxID=3034231 RepID=UPI00339B2A41
MIHSELKTLRYFTVLAETLSFTSAATKLGMSQPALSLALQRLEEQMGVPLVSRTNRSVVLTPAGKAYARGAREVLALVGQMERNVIAIASGGEGFCRIGFVQSASFDLLPELLPFLQRQLPGVRFQMSALPSYDQMYKLEEGELDLGLVRQSTFASDVLEFTLVHRQRMVAALPRTHPLANQASLKLTSLNADRFVTIDSRILAACSAAGFQPRAALEAFEVPTILSFVSGGLGVALLPASCRRFADPAVALVELEDTSEHLELPLYLVSRTRERDSAVKRVLLAAHSFTATRQL